MQFRINYEKVVSQANDIRDDADQLYAQIRRLNQLEQQCSSCWKGNAAEAFISKLRELENEMSRTRIQMENLAITIRNCADRIQREDQEEAARAAELSTGFWSD